MSVTIRKWKKCSSQSGLTSFHLNLLYCSDVLISSEKNPRGHCLHRQPVVNWSRAGKNVSLAPSMGRTVKLVVKVWVFVTMNWQRIWKKKKKNRTSQYKKIGWMRCFKINWVKKKKKETSQRPDFLVISNKRHLQIWGQFDLSMKWCDDECKSESVFVFSVRSGSNYSALWGGGSGSDRLI